MRNLSELALPAAIAAAALLTAAPAQSQEWPARPITLIVPFPPGGGTDLVVRAVQPRLSQVLGQPLVIDNRAGAGGTVGSTLAARAKPDGYTAVAVTSSTHAVSPSVYPKLPYDPVKDFSYAGLIGSSPYVLAVNPAVPGADVHALVATLAGRKPQGTFASVGVGTVSHLLGEKFRQAEGLELVHVPYRGAAPAYTDLIGGQVDLIFDNPVGLASYVKAGKLRAVATTARTSMLPGIPTFQQQGIAGFDQSLWYGFAFPKGTPDTIVARFNSALNKVLSDPAVIEDLAAKGVIAKPLDPAAMLAMVTSEVPFWAEIAKSVGATIE